MPSRAEEPAAARRPISAFRRADEGERELTITVSRAVLLRLAARPGRARHPATPLLRRLARRAAAISPPHAADRSEVAAPRPIITLQITDGTWRAAPAVDEPGGRLLNYLQIWPS